MTHFRCQKCGHTLDAKQIQDGHDRLTNELKNTDRSDITSLEDYLKKYATVLPDTHQLSREIQYGMMLLLKSTKGKVAKIVRFLTASDKVLHS